MTLYSAVGARQMDEELVAAAKRIIKLKSWEWLPGMLGVRQTPPDKVDYLKPEVRITNLRDVVTAHTFNSIPDLNDAATLGCLLQLVRKCARDPMAYVCHFDGYDSVNWAVCSSVIESHRENLDLPPRGWMRVIVADGRSEGLALAFSLEISEKFYASIEEPKRDVGR